MYKLLIVDDEQIVIDSVKFIVERQGNLHFEMETAHTGREAIEKAETFRPDIVVIDIKMPGISGLEAISEIKKFHSGALFIIITAFANFDFAKEALQMGVIEYINKPISRSKLVAALENAVKIKDEERKKLKVQLDFKEKMAFILPALENSFIYSIVLSDDHTTELKSLKKILDINFDCGYIMTIEYGQGKNKNGLVNKIGVSIKSQKLYSALRDAIKENCKGIVGPVMINRITTFVPCNAETDEYTQRIEALKIGTKIYNKLKSIDSGIDYYIGIGKCYPSLRDANKSYEESLIAIDYMDEGGVVHINDIPMERDIQRSYKQDIEQNLVKKIILGETEECVAAFEHIFCRLIEQDRGNIDKLKLNLLELVAAIWRISKDYNLNSDNAVFADCLSEYMSINNINLIRTWMIDNIRRTSDEMARAKKNNFSCIVKRAIEYLTQNYNKAITLEYMSRELNISPTYFSKIFKEETGYTFIDYLTKLRIEQAKKLIANSNYGNKEICDFVGYSDPNYFSRVFKKIVGVTPTEYRSYSMNNK
ncbi:two component system response regulator [[Clostridium] cellulosi]|uniref:Stage 0 sporulation protein A homolog n=1 Tax=[Clostridium] cellulosi TaxID=29343 RepID=A0A078KVA5_9FIRM|nr:two component system response regulator [[Clostridium] cellulosi]